MALSIASCETATAPGGTPRPGTEPPPQAARIEIPQTIRFPSFASFTTPEVNARYADGTVIRRDQVTWIIEDTTIISLEGLPSLGMFRPRLPGSTRLIAQVKTTAGQLATDTAIASVEATVVGLRLGVRTSGDLEPGQTARVGISLVDQDQNLLYDDYIPESFRRQFTWNVEDPTVVSVDSLGFVTALSPGRTTISASRNDGLHGTTPASVANILSEPPSEVLATTGTPPGFTGRFDYEGGSVIRIEESPHKGPENRWVGVNLSALVNEKPDHISRSDTVVTSANGVEYRVGSDQSLSAVQPDGSVLWRIDYLPGVLSLAGDRLLVRHRHQRMVSAVSVSDGSLLWQTEDLGIPPASYTTSGAFATNDGRVVVTGFYLNFYDLETGRYLGRTRENYGSGILILDNHLLTLNSVWLRAIDLGGVQTD